MTVSLAAGVLREREAGDWPAFRTSLAFDRATTEIAAGLVRELHVGSGATTDYVARILAALDATHEPYVIVLIADEPRGVPASSGPVDEWSLVDRFRASYDPDRSGDLLMASKPHVTPIVGILPTLAPLIHSPIPAAEIGDRCIDLDGGEGHTCLDERR